MRKALRFPELVDFLIELPDDEIDHAIGQNQAGRTASGTEVGVRSSLGEHLGFLRRQCMPWLQVLRAFSLALYC